MADGKAEKEITVIFFVEDGGDLYEIGIEKASVGAIKKVREHGSIIPEDKQPVIGSHVAMHVILQGEIKFVA